MTPPIPLAVTEHLPGGSRGDGPLVVLVHGSLDRSDSFTRVVRRLDDLHTVVYDRRGYNRSRAALPLNVTVDGHIDDLLAIIDGRPAVVGGHSYGGDVALGAAVRGGSGSSIVSVAAYEPPMPWLGTWSRRAPGPTAGEATTGNAGAAASTDPPAAAEHFFRRMIGDSAWERLSEEGKDQRRADGPALQAELDALRGSGAPFDVTTLSVPATFGMGANSASRHRLTVEWLVGHVAGAELVEIAGASHGAHLTHPDAFAALVRSTVERAGRPVQTA